MAKRTNKVKKRSYPKAAMDKQWAKKVKELAGNKCELCGFTEGLNAHHIQPRKLYSVRWYLPNGVCLCNQCHNSGPYSAHKNPFYFMVHMYHVRGIEWSNNLLCKTAETDWKDKIEEIRHELE